jgi:hypothetical protein
MQYLVAKSFVSGWKIMRRVGDTVPACAIYRTTTVDMNRADEY